MNYARRTIGGAMLLIICSTVAALACGDIERPVDTQRPPTTVGQQQGPTVISSLTCTFNRSASAIDCSPAIPSASAGVSTSVIYGTGAPGSALYGIFYPINLVKDLTAQQWSFTAYVQNLLKQSIGTLDGTTVTGVKVFVTDFHATSGTGTVSVANADGTGNFTAPNQPYFNYNQIVAPSANSGNKLWKFNVPNTVTAVSMSILVSTDFPAEQNVAAVPPATKPAWFNDDTSWTGPHHDNYLKRVITIWFKEGTSLADRQLAVASVNGAVIGGGRLSSGDGFYYVQVADDGSGSQLGAAVTRLKTLPQVEVAALTFSGSPGSLKPKDSARWNTWNLSPDTIGVEDNWQLEAIDAPLAWGCNTGSVDAQISVIDHDFLDLELSSNVVSGASNLTAYAPDTLEHGGRVSSVLAARGNDNTGMTGIMWRAGLHLVELTSYKATMADYGVLIEKEGASGAKVVNLSYWKDWHRLMHTRADSDTVFAQFNTMMPAIRRANTAGHLPLIVTIAGDSTYDAFQAVTPILHDSMPLRSLIVGGSTRQRTHSIRWSGYGRLIDVYAPGEDVTANYLSAQYGLVQTRGDGTSFSAPLVAGTAGLLMSFDSRIPIDSLRAYILEGASRGNRSITAPDGSHHYLLNAYESLKRAAEQPGAPLCGNRVYGTGAGKQIVAQRGTSTEVLVSDPALHLYAPAVYHGGNQFTFMKGMLQHLPPWPSLFPDDTGDRYQCFVANRSASGTWAVSGPRCDSEDQSVGVGLPPLTGTVEGTANSLLGLSHNGDSSVVVLQCSNDLSCFDVYVGSSANITKRAQLHHAVTQLGYTRVFAAYSPYGDRALIALESATNGPLYPPNNYWGMYSDVAVYSVRFTDGLVTTLSNWIPTTGGIIAPEISEDGTMVAAGFGVSPAPLATNHPCHIEYRNYSGTQLSPAVSIPNNDACMYAGGFTEIDRAPGAFGRRVASATIAPNVGRGTPALRRRTH